MAINIPGLIAIVFFYVVILVVGIWAGRKSNQVRRGTGEITIGEESNVMLAGRNIGLFVGVFTMTATWVGGGYINGTAEIVYKDGLVWCQAPFGYAVSLMIGGYLFAVKMRNAGYKTMLDPFQQHFGARMGCLLFIPALCGEVFWSAAILAALGATVEVIMDLQRTESVIASACIALFYTFTGGLYSVAYTDVIQLLAIFFGLWLCVPFAMFHEAVGPISYPKNDYVGSISWSDLGNYADAMLLLMMGGVPWQVYFQRVLSSRTAEGAELLSYMASFGCLFMAIPPVILGAVAKASNLTMAGYPRPFPLAKNATDLTLPLTLQYLTPKFVSAMGLGAVSAAVMSSSDSSILSAASMFAWNIYKLGIRQSASEKEVINVMRVSIVLVGALATVMALTSESIYGLWFLSSDLVYVILFPQLVCVVYLKDRVNTYGSLAGYIVGCFLRAGGGEEILGIPPFIKYPYYNYAEGKQMFPFRTLSMIVSFVVLVVSSAIASYLFSGGRVPLEWDVFKCFTPVPPKVEEEKALEVVGADLKAAAKKSPAEKLPSATVTKKPSMLSSGPDRATTETVEAASEKLSVGSRRSTSSKGRSRSDKGPSAEDKTASGFTESGSDARRKTKKRRQSSTSKKSDKSEKDSVPRSDSTSTKRSKKGDSGAQSAAAAGKSSEVAKL